MVAERDEERTRGGSWRTRDSVKVGNLDRCVRICEIQNPYIKTRSSR